MHIERLEKIFMVLGGILLAVGIAAIGASVLAADVHLPAPSGRIDPRTVRTTPPFDQPGVRQIGPNEYEAVIVAYIWAFQVSPDISSNEIHVPVGANVTFKVTSTDVIHGFMIERTDVNAMIIPGQVTEVSYTFDKPGEYLIICHEYCGTGHHTMFAKVIVA
ncbi:MAG TPA: cytochrome c oxidase subunit II [Thermomicrobiales bacterium]